MPGPVKSPIGGEGAAPTHPPEDRETHGTGVLSRSVSPDDSRPVVDHYVPAPADGIALRPRRGIDIPIIEGQQSFFDYLFVRFILSMIRRPIEENILRSRSPSNEQKEAIADVFAEYRILVEMLGLPTENLPGEDRIYVLDEDLSKTSNLGSPAYTMFGNSFLSGQVDLPVFINHLCHEVWHLRNQGRLALVKKYYFPVGVDYIAGLAVKGLIDRKRRFHGLDEAITEILAIMLRARVAWRRMPAHLSLAERFDSLGTSPILGAGVAYSIQMAVALRVIDSIAEHTELNPKEILIRFAACAAGQGSHLDLLSILSEKEIQLLSQMEEAPATAVPIAKQLGLGEQIEMILGSKFYKALFTRAFEFSGIVTEKVPDRRGTSGGHPTVHQELEHPFRHPTHHGPLFHRGHGSALTGSAMMFANMAVFSEGMGVLAMMGR